MRIKEAFNLFDYNKNCIVNFVEVKVGLERLNLYPKVKILEEDWRDLTNHGELSGDDYTLTSDQFFEVKRNQVTLYVQRMTSKALAKGDNEQSTAFVLKYLVTAIDDLRSTVISVQNTRYTPSVDDLTVLRYSTRAMPDMDSESARYQGTIEAEPQEVFFSADQGSSVVGFYTAKAVGFHDGTHLEMERDRGQDHQQGKTSSINTSITPELVAAINPPHYSLTHPNSLESLALVIHTWRGKETKSRISCRGRPAISKSPQRLSW